jgi:cell shape-determining protein MreC
MDFIPIPYFGMIMFFLVAPALTFGFIGYTKKLKAEVEKKRYEKEILELEVRKEEVHLKMLEEENRKYDSMIEFNLEKKD